MLRYLFRSPRSIRLPLKNGRFNVQKVSVTKDSRINISRFVTTFIISVCVVRTVDHVFSDRDLKRGWERLKSKDWWAEHWRQTQRQTPANGDSRIGAEDKSTIHLMLPIWVRRTERGFYRENDPRWKAFQSFAQDEKRIQEVSQEIATYITDGLKAPKYGPWIVHLQAATMMVNTEVIIPIKPPQLYEVPCVFIQQSGDVTYGWRRLPDSIGAKMDRIFHPVMLSKAFYAGCLAFADVTYLITKARLTDRLNTFRSHWDSSSPKSVKASTEEEKVNQRLMITKTSDEELKHTLPFLRGEYGENESRQLYREAVRSMTFKNAIETGCAVFRASWTTGQPNELLKNPGSFVQLKCIAHCIGDKGKLRFEVNAYYDVATNTLVGKPVITQAQIVPDVVRWHGTKSQNQSQ
ncbi:uncharacterized protein A1O9_09492, partial [Exophiala aquamarina CBS 119918]